MGKILYLDPFSGIAGDMFLGLLIDLGLDLEDLRNILDKMNIEYDLRVEKVNKRGIVATDVKVVAPEKERHNKHCVKLRDIFNVLDRLDEPIRSRAKKMFDTLAEAESKVHGVPKEELHFHEVGAIDAIVEIVGAVAGVKLLGIDKVYSGVINVGSGFVETAHGRYPVPAPATAELLKGLQIYIDPSIRTELVTPTGAVILRELVDGFAPLSLRVEKVGYGAGDKELEIPNVLRGYLGKSLSLSRLFR